MKKTLLSLLLIITMISCTSQKTILNSWIGHNKQDIYLSWGPPTRVTDDGNNGEILIYAKQVYAPELNVNYWEYKMMYANNNGKIYHWRMSRQPVAPTQIDVRFIK